MDFQQPQVIFEETPTTPLVCAAQQGDRQAFGELVRHYQGAVYATVYRRLANHAEAQELCQEVFMQALRKIDQLREPESFGGWIRAIAGRMAINRAVRRGPSMPADSETCEATCAPDETPLGSVLARERETQVQQGLGRLRGHGPRHAGRVLFPGPFAGRDEREVRLAGRHDQTPAARRPKAAGQGARGLGAGVKQES